MIQECSQNEKQKTPLRKVNCRRYKVMSRGKKVLAGLIIAIVVFAVAVIVSERQNSDTQKKEHPLFVGHGKMQEVKYLNGNGAFYNDDYIFFGYGFGEGMGKKFYRVSRKDVKDQQKLTIICRDASCSHESESCEANTGWGEYFVFRNKMYQNINDEKYNGDGTYEYLGRIEDYDTGEVVFQNNIPDDMPPEQAVDDDAQNMYIRILSDDYIKVQSHRHAYILDSEFNIRYTHFNIGKFPWGAIFGNNYYYVNDIRQLIKVDLNSGKEEALPLDCKVFLADNDEQYIYYSDELNNMYKLNISDGSKEKIAENVGMYVVLDSYIYSVNNEERVIYDKEGAKIGEFTAYENMIECAYQIGDKIYCPFTNGVAFMDADGKNYGEMKIQ